MSELREVLEAFEQAIDDCREWAHGERIKQQKKFGYGRKVTREFNLREWAEVYRNLVTGKPAAIAQAQALIIRARGYPTITPPRRQGGKKSLRNKKP